MDPNANLAEQLRIVAAVNAINDACSDDGHFTEAQTKALADHALRLAELVEALHGWMSKGGFLPSAWKGQRFHRLED